ncbi:hypothetical protein HOY80DRAFT_883939 [Tuber brumale]|nr:hypothetical protein HOY80DRAFT_883939 [Tuber brumale]
MVSTAFLAHHSATPPTRIKQMDPPIAPLHTTAMISPPPYRPKGRKPFVDQADAWGTVAHTLAHAAPTLVAYLTVLGRPRSRRNRRSTDTMR